MIIHRAASSPSFRSRAGSTIATAILTATILLTALIAAPADARGQAPADVRVSPPDPDNYLVPAYLRVQAAARIGEVRLVAWGTTENIAPGRTAGVLRMQMLRGATPFGPQRTPHGPDALPFGVVKVIPFGSRFLVLWGDLRDGGRLYMRAVGVDGEFIGGERQLSTEGVAGSDPSAITVIGSPDSGIVLVWRSSTGGGAYALRIDPDGEPSGNAAWLGPQMSPILTYETLPGLHLLRFSDGSGRIIHGNGRIDPRSIPAGRLTLPFHLDADTSLTCVNGRTLVRYANVHDPAPAGTTSVPALDSATPGLVAVTRDPSGIRSVVFGVVTVTTGRNTPSKPGICRTTFYRVPATGGSSDTAVQLYQVHLTQMSLNNGNGWVYDLENVLGQGVGCSNIAMFAVRFRSTEFYHGDPVPIEKFDTVRASLTADGRVVAGSAGYQSLCVPPDTMQPVRLRSDSLSIVRVMVDGAPVDLEALAGHVIVNLPQRGPGVMARGDSLLVFYIHADRYADLTLWRDSPVRIDRIAQDTLPAADTIRSAFNSAASVLRRFSQLDSTLGRGEIGLRFTSMFRQDEVSYWPTPKSRDYIDVYQSRSELAIARGDGWRMIRRARATDRLGTRTGSYLYYDVQGRDPGRREMLVRAHDYDAGAGYKLDTLVALDGDGEVRWALPAPVRADLLLPVDSAAYLAIVGGRGIRMIGRDSVAGFPLPLLEGGASMRLRGDRFLNWAAHSDTVLLRLFDLNGAMLADTAVAVDTIIGIPCIVENQRDGSLVILYAGRGIRAVHCSRDLARVDADIPVSAADGGALRPAGIIRNDTLYAVWEDTRNGVSDIYGTGVHLPSMDSTGLADTSEPITSSTDAGVIPSLRIERVYPNPSNGHASVDCAADGEVVVEVADPLGRVVWRARRALQGRGSIDVDIARLAKGAYLVSLRSGDRAVAAPLIVAH